MSHPALWPGKTFYYPIGNTPPVDLLQHLAPEENADVLLLGCGDPRNILFTLFTQSKASITRRIVITCCDAEAAVLARNVLLFTLIVDNDNQNLEQELWNIFYHLYLDAPSYNLLISQCQKLVKLSTSLDSWNSSRYASFLRFCSSDSLQSIHKIWVLSAEHASLPRAAKEHISRIVHRGTEAALKKASGSAPVLSTRAAGPLFLEAFSVDTGSFTQFWKTGVVSDTETRQKGTILNPTLYYTSTSRFDLHYGTNPLSSFHLARALAYIETKDRTRAHPPKTAKSIVADAHQQFQSWCSAARVMLAGPGVMIRIFCGEAIALGYALRSQSQGQSAMRPFVRPLSTRLLWLDDSDYKGQNQNAPTAFNVVDTSNLADHVGLLNLLAATGPLLSSVPTATLYTETLLPASFDVLKGFQENLCMDPAVFQVFFGVSPISSAYQFMTHSSAHEWSRNLVPSNDPGNYHERILWKNLGGTEQPTSITLAASQVARLLFNLYLDVFSQENVGTQLANISLRSMQQMDIIHNVRGSFAALLVIARERLTSLDWDAIMDHFVVLIENDRTLLMGPNYFQDLFCQLYLYGVFDADKFFPEWNTSVRAPGPHVRFKTWSLFPTVVHVALVVPRERVDLARELLSEGGTPVLQAQASCAGGSDATFASVKIVFGYVSGQPSVTGEGPIMIKEDPGGLEGTAPMIVMFHMPTYLLLRSDSPRAERFIVSFRGSPGIAMRLVPKLGLGLQLFSVDISDETQVHVSRELPHYYHARVSAASSGQHGSRTKISISLDKDCRRINATTVRVDLSDKEEKEALLGGASVSLEQLSASTIHAVFSGHRLEFPFPHLVNSKSAKTRIARKSAYIEIIAGVWSPSDRGWDATINRFPVINPASKEITPVNIHHVTLESLPIIDLSVEKQQLKWLELHPALALSEREKVIRTSQAYKGNADDCDTLVSFKDSMHALFIRSAGLQGSDIARVIGLQDPSGTGIYTIIFVLGLRLDLSAHTVVLDSFVLPLTESLMDQPRFQKLLGGIQRSGLQIVVTPPNEVKAWKMLLPAFVERCRQWHHLDTCEYSKAAIPLSVAVAASPICSCGKGKCIDAFLAVKEWAGLAPYVTRAAISPLFAVPYLERMGSADHGSGVGAPFASGGASAGPRPAESCARCAGPGKPRLLTCGRCKRAKYCSTECQRADWKQHKPQCI